MGARGEDEEGETGFGESWGREDVEDMFAVVVCVTWYSKAYISRASRCYGSKTSELIVLGMKVDLCSGLNIQVR